MDLLRSLPIGLYLEQPITWLHYVDSRVKLAWLMTFLITPVLANSSWRLFLVVLLILLTLSAAIPWRVWKQQMGFLLLFSFFVFLLSLFAPDGVSVSHQPRLPVDELTFLEKTNPLPVNSSSVPWYNPFQKSEKNTVTPSPSPPVNPPLPPATNYQYVLWKQGPLKITRRSLELASRVSTLFFTVVYSTTLFLLTTASEEITAGMEELMEPLRSLRVPVTEIALTFTLSLRFIPLVLEEVQNLIRSVSTRAINWKKLGIRGAIQVWLMLAERLLENLLLRAEQIASAMKVRGFTTPAQHRVEWHQLQLRRLDWLALVGLGFLWGFRFVIGWE